MKIEVTERPNKKDYDFNDLFEGVRFAKDMSSYADYLEQQLKEESPKKEYIIEYDKPWVINSLYQPKQLDIEINKNAALYTLGELRATKENIIHKQKRNKRGNLLEALVENLQGELGDGEWSIYHNGKQFISGRTYDMLTPGIVLMHQQTAEKACELLNSGQYSLEE